MVPVSCNFHCYIWVAGLEGPFVGSLRRAASPLSLGCWFGAAACFMWFGLCGGAAEGAGSDAGPDQPKSWMEV